jgi:predicted DsbA family dithiol-disulfide isomerase
MGSNPEQLDLEHLVGYAADLKIDSGKFRSCVESGKYKKAIQADLAEANRIGADGTPAFVLGRSTKEGVDGELVVGALPYASFDQKLKDLAP